MTDWPDNLIDTLARAEWEADKLDDTLWDGDEGAALYYHGVRAVLAALAEWCDGDLFDPATGQRIVKWDARIDLPILGPRGLVSEPLFTLSPRED